MKKRRIIIVLFLTLSIHESQKPAPRATLIATHKTAMSPTEQKLHDVMKSHSATLKQLSIDKLKKHKEDIEKARKSLLSALYEADPIERTAHAELEKLLQTLKLDEVVDSIDKLKKAIAKLHPETQALVKSLLPALTRVALGLY